MKRKSVSLFFKIKYTGFKIGVVVWGGGQKNYADEESEFCLIYIQQEPFTPRTLEFMKQRGFGDPLCLIRLFSAPKFDAVFVFLLSSALQRLSLRVALTPIFRSLSCPIYSSTVAEGSF